MSNLQQLRTHLTRCLFYNRRTGVFKWRRRFGRGRMLEGAVAGYVQNRYIVIEADSTPYKAHRLAWLFVYGRWPRGRLDHKNRQPADNRFSNLREATDSQNVINVGVRVHNTSGETGVAYRCHGRKRWAAYVNINKKRVHLGCFLTRAEAVHTRRIVAARVYGEFFAGATS